MKVNILGVEYTIETHKMSEDEILKENHWVGYCEETLKKIVVADVSEKPYFELSTEEQGIERKRILRHEIVHAFLTESGLSDSTLRPDDGWAKNEEMVDWFAVQSPKIFQTFQECDCL